MKGSSVLLVNRFTLAADAMQHAKYLKEKHPKSEVTVNSSVIKDYKGPYQEEKTGL